MMSARSRWTEAETVGRSWDHSPGTLRCLLGPEPSEGWTGLAGNHVLIRVCADGPFVGLCHLQRGSIRGCVGQAVQAGQPPISAGVDQPSSGSAGRSLITFAGTPAATL